MQKHTLISFLLVYTLTLSAWSQDIPIGTWRHHLPNRTVVSLAEKPGYIFGATPFGLLIYDKAFNSISKIDKVSGLSDFGINVIRYSDQKDLLLMGYQNGIIDVMKGRQIFSIPDIWQASILGSKSIHNIFFDEHIAYLSTGFGVVVLDLNLFVILDTWFIGPEGSMLNVYDFHKHDGFFYAATEAGLLRAPVDAPNLADFQYWMPTPGLQNLPFNRVLTHSNKLLANLSGPAGDTLYIRENQQWSAFLPQTQHGFFGPKTHIRSSHGSLLISSLDGVFAFGPEFEPQGEYIWHPGLRVEAYDVLKDLQGTLWFAERSLGLVKRDSDFESIIVEGPAFAESFGLAHNRSSLWVAPGSILGGWQNTFNDRGIFLFKDGKWAQYSRSEFPQINHVRDIHSITPDPRNPARVFAAAWSGGLLEFDQQEGLITLYNEQNSTLQKRAIAGDIIRIGGSAWDSRGNLWVSNSDADHFLSVRQPNGNWMSYPHNGAVSGNETLGRIIVDNADQKWVAMPRGGGIIVFKETSLDNNVTFDIRKLTTQEGNGSLPSNRVTTLVKDKDGYIWVGTNAGVAVFYSPHLALRGQTFDAQSIIVVQDGFAGLLFANEIINTIFVDGSNKKWFGTVGSGAFLLSPDGRETLKHFTSNNSPLPSNNILDISVDPVSGEVFFATDRGLVSYRGFATEGGSRHSEVQVFPNPVRPGYSGFIAVRGLVNNARVKITDINGNLIHDAFAEGGQLVWDGYDVRGNRPASGVYLVFSTNPDGTETLVSRFVMIK